MAKRAKLSKVNMGEQTFRFQCKAYRLPEPCEQFHYAREFGRQFRADFAFPKFGLLVEIQGGIWTRGAHGHPIGIEVDIERSQYAALAGYLRMLTTCEQVMSGHAIAWTQRILSKRGWVEGSIDAMPFEQATLME